MNKVYVVVASGGRYDDAWTRNECAYLDKDEAELHSIKMTEMVERVKPLFDKIMNKWYALHQTPDPEFKDEEMPRYPVGPAKNSKESDKAYQLELDEWQRITAPITKRNLKRRNDFMAKCMTICREYAKELGLSDEEMTYVGLSQDRLSPYGFDDDAEYEVQELELKG